MPFSNVFISTKHGKNTMNSARLYNLFYLIATMMSYIAYLIPTSIQKKILFTQLRSPMTSYA